MRSFLTSVLGAVLVLGACAPAAQSLASDSATASAPVLSLSEWRAPSGQRCVVRPEPTPLPAFGALFDSVAVAAVASEFPARGAALYSVAIDSLGILSELRLIESTLPEEEAVALQDTLIHFAKSGGSEAREVRPEVRNIHVRVRLDTGGTPGMRVGYSEECPPEMRDRRHLERLLAEANARARRSGQVELWIFIGEDGRVRQARVVGSSGDTFLDGIAVGLVSQIEFSPALLDRKPVPVWTKFPITFRVAG